MNSTSSNEKEPQWLTNRWRIFQDLLNRTDFMNEFEQLKRQRAKEEYPVPITMDVRLWDTFKKHSAPWSCMGPIGLLYDRPEATDDELKATIPAPIRWVSPATKEAGPAPSYEPVPDFHEEFEQWSRHHKVEQNDRFRIEIEPNVKRSEVDDFIGYYWNQIAPRLGNTNETSEFYNPPRLAQRIDEPNALEEAVYTLRETGMPYKYILEQLDIDNEYDEPGLRKMVERAKKKRKT